MAQVFDAFPRPSLSRILHQAAAISNSQKSFLLQGQSAPKNCFGETKHFFKKTNGNKHM